MGTRVACSTRLSSSKSLFLLFAAMHGVLGCTSFRDCAEVDTTAAEALPARLSETGLFADIAAGTIAPGVIPFEPRFPLWTDGATKARWLLLPPGGVVDTQSTDDWRFPVGTKLFKAFTRDGVLVETRMNVKREAGWTGAAYVWTAEGDALRTTAGATDARGTGHDVPNAAQCMACHGGRPDFVLGFSAVQLAPETRTALFEQGVLSHATPGRLDVDPALARGLGVLHANCSHCHNLTRMDQPQATGCFDPGDEGGFDFSLPSQLSDIHGVPAFKTARDLLGTVGDSAVLSRMSSRNMDEFNPTMPPLGTEIVDDHGVAAVRALIEALPAQP